MPVRVTVNASVMTNRNISYTNAAQGAKESSATDAVSGLVANATASVYKQLYTAFSRLTWRQADKETRRQGDKETKRQRAKEPRSQGAKQPSNQGAKEPRSLQPRSLGA